MCVCVCMCACLCVLCEKGGGLHVPVYAKFFTLYTWILLLLMFP